MTTAAADTVLERAMGGKPSRTRALLTAGLAAVAAGTLVYKLLRSGGAQDRM